MVPGTLVSNPSKKVRLKVPADWVQSELNLDEEIQMLAKRRTCIMYMNHEENDDVNRHCSDVFKDADDAAEGISSGVPS